MKMIFTFFVGIGLLQFNLAPPSQISPSLDSNRQFKFGIDSSKIGQTFLGVEALNISTNTMQNLPQTSKKVQFYNFWFSSCGPCIAEMPMLNRLEKKYREQVEFNAINFQSRADILQFLRGTEFNFKQFHLSKKEIQGLKVTFGYPTTIMVKNKKIIYCSFGGPTVDSDDLEIKMNQIQKEMEGFIEGGLEIKLD